MTPITEPSQVEQCRTFAAEMMLAEDESEFNPDWVYEHGWKVAPVESAARIPAADIARLVSVLREKGCANCIAVLTEAGCLQPLTQDNQLSGEMPTCYLVSVDEADLQRVNREPGPFRFLLTDELRSWAISCNEWYNLFASKPDLPAALLGESVDQAQRRFPEFASELADGKADEPLMKVALHYAAL